MEDFEKGELKQEEKRYYYAQINDEGICECIIDTHGSIQAKNMIELESYDLSLLGKRYTDGAWQEVKKEEDISEEEIFRAELLLSQAEIKLKQEEQDEVLAEILLNQMGV